MIIICIFLVIFFSFLFYKNFNKKEFPPQHQPCDRGRPAFVLSGCLPYQGLAYINAVQQRRNFLTSALNLVGYPW